MYKTILQEEGTLNKFKPFLVSDVMGTWNSILHYSKKTPHQLLGALQIKNKNWSRNTTHYQSIKQPSHFTPWTLKATVPMAFMDSWEKCLRRLKENVNSTKKNWKCYIKDQNIILNQFLQWNTSEMDGHHVFSVSYNLWHVQTIMNSSTLENNMQMKLLFSSTVLLS